MGQIAVPPQQPGRAELSRPSQFAKLQSDSAIPSTLVTTQAGVSEPCWQPCTGLPITMLLLSMLLLLSADLALTQDETPCMYLRQAQAAASSMRVMTLCAGCAGRAWRGPIPVAQSFAIAVERLRYHTVTFAQRGTFVSLFAGAAGTVVLMTRPLKLACG